MILYDYENDIQKIVNTFDTICGTISRHLKNKIRKDTRLKFYKPVAHLTLLYESESWVLTKKQIDIFRVQKSRNEIFKSH